MENVFNRFGYFPGGGETWFRGRVGGALWRCLLLRSVHVLVFVGEKKTKQKNERDLCVAITIGCWNTESYLFFQLIESRFCVRVLDRLTLVISSGI